MLHAEAGRAACRGVQYGAAVQGPGGDDAAAAVGHYAQPCNKVRLPAPSHPAESIRTICSSQGRQQG
ncbi:hypothetical protein HaLaN_15318 [Haematococcus lacustris]|uniref:Uncharacterized protein n=1 Tax=Haematococcus lacustris TaxID=44745 RepID=A0A699ZAR3_HAELA|nr:hypothetical protein HaLaN_15318 [Haematococcus lacustris]